MDFFNRRLARLHWLLHRRRVVAIWAAGALIVCLWIGWAVYTGTTNGWTAAVGVLITWPLLAGLASLIAFAGIGVHRLTQRRRMPAAPAIAGAGPPPKLPKGHDSVTTLTFPS